MSCSPSKQRRASAHAENDPPSAMSASPCGEWSALLPTPTKQTHQYLKKRFSLADVSNTPSPQHPAPPNKSAKPQSQSSPSPQHGNLSMKEFLRGAASPSKAGAIMAKEKRVRELSGAAKLRAAPSSPAPTSSASSASTLASSQPAPSASGPSSFAAAASASSSASSSAFSSINPPTHHASPAPPRTVPEVPPLDPTLASLLEPFAGGHLLKLKASKESGKAAWNKRWFEVIDGNLSYHRTQGSSQLGWVPMERINHVEALPSGSVIPGATGCGCGCVGVSAPPRVARSVPVWVYVGVFDPFSLI